MAGLFIVIVNNMEKKLKPKDQERINKFSDLFLSYLVMDKLIKNEDIEINSNKHSIHEFGEISKYLPNSTVDFFGIRIILDNSILIECMINADNSDLVLCINGRGLDENINFWDYLIGLKLNVKYEKIKDIIFHLDSWTLNTYFLNIEHDDIVAKIIELYFNK